MSDRLTRSLGNTCKPVTCGQNGFLFYDNPFPDFATQLHFSDNLTIMSQDLLVASDSDGAYSLVDINSDLPARFQRKRPDAFKDIISDYRLILIEHLGEDTNLYLVSNRAGNGRIYYHTIESGIVFSSDFRFLLKLVPLDVDRTAIYSILKYGAVPEPMTISTNIAAVPPSHYVHYDVFKDSYRTSSYFQFEFPCDQRPQAADDFDTAIQPARQALRKSAQFLRQFEPAILISGGIDSSLYASYLNQFDGDRLQGVNCRFGSEDSEFVFAKMFAERINADLHIGNMRQEDALTVLDDAVALTGHPFADFSSLTIVYILKFIKQNVKQTTMLIEGNGGDDCFGFADLANQSKMRTKSYFPGACKSMISSLFGNAKAWQWESRQGFLARIIALADDHEINPLNYFLVFSPVNFLGLNDCETWDKVINDTMESVFSSCGKGYETLSYEARVTIRQLLHINSRQWAAKAFSPGESLGIRTIYPYIWADILTLQGAIPWKAKINAGIVKWPLKRLLEEFMPPEFIYRKKSGFVPPFVQWLTMRNFNYKVREVLLSSHGTVNRIVPARIITGLLDDALKGQRLRYPVLNFLWGALFTEMWLQRYRNTLEISLQ